MHYDLMITDGRNVVVPAVEDGVDWSTERQGAPGKLTFSVVDDGKGLIQEGNMVTFSVDGQPVFMGYVFKKSRDREKVISLTCYDQLRYLKNKDTYTFVGKKASEILKIICKDFGLTAGEIADTGYTIAKRAESNKTLFDMIQEALQITMQNTGKIYCLYDDFGKITLKSILDLKIPLVINEETGQNFDYTSSIDSDTYNRVKLVYENKNGGKRDLYIREDKKNVSQWGMLQYFDTLKEGENGEAKAQELLKFYNRKSRTLQIKDAFGDPRVRAGTVPIVMLETGDVALSHTMLCEKATHRFENQFHTMDLTLRGGDFIV